MSEKAMLPIKRTLSINDPSKVAQMCSTTRPFAQNLISCDFKHSKTLEKQEIKKLFELKGTLFVFS